MPEQPKEYYEKKPGHTVKSGVPDGTGRIIDYSVTTDLNQGFMYTQDGMKFDQCQKTSYELSGEKCQEGEPAKIIRAANGNIVIEALDGDVIIRANNIRLVAADGSGEITLSSGKHIATNAPKVTIKGTNNDILATSTASVAGNFVDSVAGVAASGGTVTDATQGSFLGGLMKILQKFKKWLECGG